MYVTDCSTRTKWFERFMKGARLKMGGIKRENIGLTEEMTRDLLELMSDCWEIKKDDQAKGKIAEVEVYLLCTICGGLRGDEVYLCWHYKGSLSFGTEEELTPHHMSC